MNNQNQNEASDRHSEFTSPDNMAVFSKTFHGQQAGQPFYHSWKHRQSHSWHSGFNRFFNDSAQPSNFTHSCEYAWDTSALDQSVGYLDDMGAFTSPDDLVKTFTSLTPPGNFRLSRETSIRSLSKTSDSHTSGSFQRRRSFEADQDPLYPMFSPRLTSTPEEAPLQDHSFVSPKPPTPRGTDHTRLSSPWHRRLGGRRLLFSSEDEEAVYYLITKYLLPVEDQYLYMDC